jgi:HAD superfamily phosphoserine phosphatase-like hydrolase
MKRVKYKLVAFDLDGTVVDGTDSIWATILEYLGLQNHPQRHENRRRFFAGEIDYAGWAQVDLRMMKKHGANREKIMKAIEGVRLMKGAMETLESLKREGAKLAVVSGSLQIVLEKLIPDYERIFDYVYVNRIYFKRDGSIDRIDAKHDFLDKSKSLIEMCKAEGIEPKDCAFVGDQYNDVDIAKLAGFAIAFNSKSKKLEDVCDVTIRKKDLREILKHLD